MYKRGGAAAAVFYEMPKYSMNLDFSILIEYGSGFFLSHASAEGSREPYSGYAITKWCRYERNLVRKKALSGVV